MGEIAGRAAEQMAEQTTEQIELSGLYMEGAFEGSRIRKYQMHIAPGEHAAARLEAIQELSQAKEWFYQEFSGRTAAVRQRGNPVPLFCGIVGESAMTVKGGTCELTITLVSGSTLLDLKEDSRSYQDGGLTYRQIIKETTAEIPGGAVIFSGIGEEAAGQPLIRYRETAWAFLARLGSHRGQPLVPDINTTGAPRLYVGLPKVQKSPVVWHDWEIVKTIQDGRYLEVGGKDAGARETDYLRYDARGKKNLRIGQSCLIKGRQMCIVGIDAETILEDVVFTYHIAPEGFCYVPKQYNQKISGMSLLGTVVSRAGEDLWLHLDIDGERKSADNWPWPWTPPTGNFMYLMPKTGSRVSLYFSNGDERCGKGINCIGQGGGGSPKDRWLKTEHGKSLNLMESELSLLSPNGGNSIRMSGESVKLKGNNIGISASEIKVSGTRIDIRASKVQAGCGSYGGGEEVSFKPTAYLEMSGQDSSIHGEDKTKLRSIQPCRQYEPYSDAPEEGEFNVGKAARHAAVAVVVVEGAIIVVCVTGGMATPLLLAQTTLLAGTAGAGMVATDYMNGKVSNQSSYIMGVANVELMFFTNMAANEVIKSMKLGYMGGLAVREGAMAGAGAVQQLVMEGEINYQQLATNLLINTIWDVGMDGVGSLKFGKVGNEFDGGSGAGMGASRKNPSPKIKGAKFNKRRKGPLEGPGQTFGSAFGEMSPEDTLRYNQYWDDVKTGKYDMPYGMTDDEYYQFLKGVNKVDWAIKGGTSAHNITQYEKLKSSYAANEIINAERVGSGLKPDPYHRAASFIPEEQLAQGRTFAFTNGDGRKMTMLQTEGEFNGLSGIYEYILNPKGQIEHQIFKPGAGIIGP